MNKTKQIILISCLSGMLLALIIVIAVGVSIQKKEAKQTTTQAVADTTEKKTSESSSTEKPADNTTEDPDIDYDYSDYDLIDYAVFVKYLEYYSDDGFVSRQPGNYAGCELVDSDSDGYPELYVNKLRNGVYMSSYVIAGSNHPGICIHGYTSPSGDAQIMYSCTEDRPYYQENNATVAFAYQNYSYWENNDFVLRGSYEKMSDFSNADTVTVQQKATWDKKEQQKTFVGEDNSKLYDAWHKNVERLDLRLLNDDSGMLKHVDVGDDLELTCKKIENHLRKIGVSYETVNFDFDGNGINEQVYVTRDYIQSWTSNVNNISQLEGDVFCSGIMPKGSVCIIVDPSMDSGSTIYVDIRPEIKNVKEIVLSDVMTVVNTDGTSQVFNRFTPYDDCVFWYAEENQYNEQSTEDESDIYYDYEEEDYVDGFFNRNGFYGVWCSAFKTEEEAYAFVDNLSSQGYYLQVTLTTWWSNLNSDPYYVVTYGAYDTKEDAEAALQDIQNVCADAYVKYSGAYVGN